MQLTLLESRHLCRNHHRLPCCDLQFQFLNLYMLNKAVVATRLPTKATLLNSASCGMSNPLPSSLHITSSVVFFN